MQKKASVIKLGDFFRMDGNLCEIFEISRTRSRREEQIHVKMKNVHNDNIMSYIFRSNDNIDFVEIEKKSMILLSEDLDYCQFEDKNDYSQITISKEIISGKEFLSDNLEVEVYFDGFAPVKVELPLEIESVVGQAEVYQATGPVGQQQKKVVLTNGVEVFAPLSIAVGDLIVVNRGTMQFVRRIA